MQCQENGVCNLFHLGNCYLSIIFYNPFQLIKTRQVIKRMLLLILMCFNPCCAEIGPRVSIIFTFIVHHQNPVGSRSKKLQTMQCELDVKRHFFLLPIHPPTPKGAFSCFNPFVNVRYMEQHNAALTMDDGFIFNNKKCKRLRD